MKLKQIVLNIKENLKEETKVELEDFSVQHEFAFIWRKGSVFQEEYRKFFAAEEEDVR